MLTNWKCGWLRIIRRFKRVVILTGKVRVTLDQSLRLRGNDVNSREAFFYAAQGSNAGGP